MPHGRECSLLWACRLEALARKPGNVHPEASFHDLTCADFLRSAEIVAPILSQASDLPIGKCVLSAIRATRLQVQTNTNLGIVLLLAPLASVSPQISLESGISDILQRLTVEDAALAYEAIRVAHPGGLGESSNQDIRETPTVTLLEAMSLAAERDSIAAQYANRFADVFAGVDFLRSESEFFEERWESAIIRLALWLQTRIPDTLIERKCGKEIAREASRRCAEVLKKWSLDNPAWPTAALQDLDRWFRADGNRRNPGTTADLVAAVLFAAFREQVLPVPSLWKQIPEIRLGND